jgi:pimeloyl-ACP methyl ester carboxylesterase
VAGWRIFARVSERAGNAPAVVLVHGLSMSSSYMVPLALHLAPSFRVYAPDLPGFGRSQKPPRALGIPQLADVLRAWINDAGIRRAIVVGNSVGCQVMVELAGIRPDLMDAAVLLGPTMDATAPHWSAHVWRLLKDQMHERPSLIALEFSGFFGNGPRLTLETFRKALRHDMLGRGSQITAPAVIMRGEHDHLVSRRWVHMLADRMPGARVVEVPGAGHALNHNSPQAVGAVVRNLL